MTIVVSSVAELRALKALGGRPRTEVRGSFTARELLDGLHAHQITHLMLTDNPEIRCLEFIRDFRALESLTIQGCPSVESLAPLAETPIRSLGLSGRDSSVVPIRGLDGLRHTRSLVVLAGLPSDGMATLPTGAPLNDLTLGQPIGSSFTRVASWPRLKHIQLARISYEFAEYQWRALTHLPELEHFAFGLAEERDTLRIPPGLQLPQVKILSILNPARRRASHLSHLLEAALPAFPGVRKLFIYGNVDAPINLSPTAALPDLQEVFLSYVRPKPGHALPPHIKLTLYPRPRT